MHLDAIGGLLPFAALAGDRRWRSGKHAWLRSQMRLPIKQSGRFIVPANIDYWGIHVIIFVYT
jgi:hypothetical protein